MENKISKVSKTAADIILSYPKNIRIRVVSHYDADGITAATIMSKALYRAGYDFQTTLMRNPFDKGFVRLSKEDNKLIIFLDMGSGQIDTIEKFNCNSIIVDHHQYHRKETAENVFQINANLCDINGNYEACGATLAYSLAKAIDPINKDLVSYALAGATGDKQYIGGIRGYNKDVVDEGLNEGFIQEKVEIKLYGDSLFDALFYSIEPFYSGLSGNKKGITELLEKIGISKDIKIKDLTIEQKKQLQSFLMLKLVEKGCEKNILDTVIRTRYRSDILGCEMERFADLLDSCGKGGNRALGLSLCLGDKKSLEDALVHEKNFKEKVLEELIKLDSDGAKEKKSMRYFYSNDSSLGGVVGGIAMNYIFDREKPLISIVKKDDELHVSCRGTQYLVSKGLDLGYAMKEAANKLGGHGGGHAIASGATIDASKEDEFLKIVDEIIGKQIKG